MDSGTVKGILDWTRPVESLDRVLVHDGDLTYGDLLSDTANIDGRGDPVDVVLDAARFRDITRTLGGILDPRSAMIIARRYGIGAEAGEETLQAIADDLHVTRERVRQLEVKAMGALTAAAVEGGLYEYLIADTRLGVATPPPDWSPPTDAKKGKKEPLKPGGRRRGTTPPETQIRS
jgi:DNA-directed RNA polymerase sigma subunit (sigma70/sigma32)